VTLEITLESQVTLHWKISLCYNAIVMQNQFRFANNDNNNDNDDLRIVGRSFAG